MSRLVYISFLVILLLFSCKKSKEARQLEKEINDTKWEFYYAEDADGNDITAQVQADSVICECFEFYKTDKDATTFNANISRCHGTYFENYYASWGVYDWKKIEKDLKKDGLEGTSINNRWADFSFVVGNMGLENIKSVVYLRSRDLIFEETVLIEPRYKLKPNGFNTDTLLEYRYYKKVE